MSMYTRLTSRVVKSEAQSTNRVFLSLLLPFFNQTGRVSGLPCLILLACILVYTCLD